MRKKLREGGVDYTVYKNTLIKRAIEGTDYAPLAEVLEGPTAIAISSEDATAPARMLNEIIKQYKKMEFKAGVVEGAYYDKAGIEQIADIPSRDGLIAKLWEASSRQSASSSERCRPLPMTRAKALRLNSLAFFRKSRIYAGTTEENDRKII